MDETLGNVLDALVRQSLAGRPPTRDQALRVLASADDEVLDVVAAGARVRRHFFGNRVKLNLIVNMKSGLCPEDCAYCSQRRGASSDVLAYNWLDPDEALAMADRAVDHGVARVCLVASGRGPSERDVGRVAETVRRIKDRHPWVEVCTSLGLLAPERARQLAGAGVDAYNHNLNTSEAHYGAICSTHTFADRRATVACAQEAGLSPCSGVIFGMGESDEDVVEAALALRALDPDSVPVNFLMPFAGTPLAGRFDLTPQRCLRILALFRFFFPDAEVRIAGGRELHLRSLQGLGLHLANSIFLGDYLTSEGQAAEADLRMIADGGFVLEGATPATLPRADGRLLTLRRRGPGTAAPANV